MKSTPTIATHLATHLATHKTAASTNSPRSIRNVHLVEQQSTLAQQSTNIIQPIIDAANAFFKSHDYTSELNGLVTQLDHTASSFNDFIQHHTGTSVTTHKTPTHEKETDQIIVLLEGLHQAHNLFCDFNSLLRTPNNMFFTTPFKEPLTAAVIHLTSQPNRSFYLKQSSLAAQYMRTLEQQLTLTIYQQYKLVALRAISIECHPRPALYRSRHAPDGIEDNQLIPLVKKLLLHNHRSRENSEDIEFHPIEDVYHSLSNIVTNLTSKIKNIGEAKIDNPEFDGICYYHPTSALKEALDVLHIISLHIKEQGDYVLPIDQQILESVKIIITALVNNGASITRNLILPEQPQHDFFVDFPPLRLNSTHLPYRSALDSLKNHSHQISFVFELLKKSPSTELIRIFNTLKVSDPNLSFTIHNRNPSYLDLFIRHLIQSSSYTQDGKLTLQNVKMATLSAKAPGLLLRLCLYSTLSIINSKPLSPQQHKGKSRPNQQTEITRKILGIVTKTMNTPFNPYNPEEQKAIFSLRVYDKLILSLYKKPTMSSSNSIIRLATTSKEFQQRLSVTKATAASSERQTALDNTHCLNDPTVLALIIPFLINCSDSIRELTTTSKKCQQQLSVQKALKNNPCLSDSTVLSLVKPFLL